ncbi:prealbumin-like fold domain-containing protein [Solilutibacter silvestris]|uniref:prealbumin-like fold domain-containing protein n=1 Tax=Solilutibacter silvestris TaxID=1645665 RepID=UPI003D32D539
MNEGTFQPKLSGRLALAFIRLCFAVTVMVGAPMVAHAQTVVFKEDFENNPDNTTTGEKGLAPPIAAGEIQYVAASGMTYSASTQWANANFCNGIVLSAANGDYQTAGSTTSSAATASGSELPWTSLDNGKCRPAAGSQSYNAIRSLARGIGQFLINAGIPNADSNIDHNHIVSSYTECPAGTCGTLGTGNTNGRMFDMPTTIAVTGNHYYTMSIVVGAANCTNPPQLQFQLFDAATPNSPVNIGTPQDPCVGATTISVTNLQISPFSSPSNISVRQVPANAAVKFTGTQLGFRVINNQGAEFGNDTGFDNIVVTDVTPRLSKAFSPAMVTPGSTAQITFTVTNTSDNLAKAGWSFTDNLTSGLTLANTTIGGTCLNSAGTAGTTASLTSGAAGSTSFTIGGSLPAVASCTITVNVQVAGTVTANQLQNCPANIANLSFINPPTICATLAIARNVSLTKQWVNAISGNAVSLAVQNATPATVASGTSTAPASGATPNGAIQIGTTATISEAFTSGSASSYVQTFVCRKTSDNSVVTTTASGLSASFTVPGDSDVTCTVTNTGTAKLTIRKSVPSGQGTSFDFSQSGIPSPAVTTFSLNPSTAGSGGTLFADQVFTGVPSGTAISVNELASASTSAYSVTDLTCTNQGSGSTGSTFAYTISNGALNGSPKATANVTLTAGADVLCTYTNTKNASIVITKNTVGGDGTFTFNETAASLGVLPVGVTPTPPHTLTTSGGTAAINTQITGITLLGANVTISENAPPAGFFLQSIACTNLATGTALTTATTPSATVTLASRQVVLGGVVTGNQINCTFTNGAFPKVTIKKLSNGGTGSFSFSGGTNGLPAALTLDTTTTNPQTSTTYTLAAVNTASSLTETIPAGWMLSSIVCTDVANNAISVTANTATGQLTIPAASVVAGANYTCTFTNAKQPTLTLVKTVTNDNGGTQLATAWTLTATGPVTITGATGSGTVTNAVVPTGTYALSESGPANYVAGPWSCTAGTLSGSSVTLASGQNATCTINNNDSNQADLSIIKTNGANSLVSGATTTYTITVSNAGPATATGAIVKDTPTSGLTCPPGNAVTCSGTGCPAGPLTVTSLTSGVTMGTMPANSTATFTVTCNVN